MKISTWIKSGVIDKNIKDSLDSTVESLHSICPLRANKKSIHESLRDVLDRDQSFREKTMANIQVHKWLSPTAKFNKKRYDRSSAIANRENPLPVEEFSFLTNKQRAIVKTFYTLIELELYTFLYDHAGIIPAKIVKTFSKKQRLKIKTDFENADTLTMINFITENLIIFMNKSVFYNENPLEVFMDYKKSV
ncbi:hypothetical protein C1645_274236 [Glomus cerebriforme]|uniref:Uncharacterized protein n=1 Tax=Glomus cerebriforme TaxID=658196 RepID=A0A397SNA1_9GLOM|nr:hypothetical protein C1645_274236 [Glomus cerebriforme]